MGGCAGGGRGCGSQAAGQQRARPHLGQLVAEVLRAAAGIRLGARDRRVELLRPLAERRHRLRLRVSSGSTHGHAQLHWGGGASGRACMLNEAHVRPDPMHAHEHTTRHKQAQRVRLDATCKVRTSAHKQKQQSAGSLTLVMHISWYAFSSRPAACSSVTPPASARATRFFASLCSRSARNLSRASTSAAPPSASLHSCGPVRGGAAAHAQVQQQHTTSARVKRRGSGGGGSAQTHGCACHALALYVSIVLAAMTEMHAERTFSASARSSASWPSTVSASCCSRATCAATPCSAPPPPQQQQQAETAAPHAPLSRRMQACARIDRRAAAYASLPMPASNGSGCSSRRVSAPRPWPPRPRGTA